MSNPAHVVIRLVPQAPVDGATFSSYLDGLKLKLVDANAGTDVSDEVDVSPLTLFEWPPGSNYFLTTATQTVASDTAYVQAGGKFNYGNTLKLTSATRISAGAFVYSTDQTTIPPNAGINGHGLTVTAVTQDSATSATVTLSDTLPNQVSAGMTVAFVGILDLPGGSINTTQDPPAAQFQCKPASGSPTANPSVLRFDGDGAAGIPVGAQLSPVPGLVAARTTVTGATGSTLDLSPAILGRLPAHPALTLTFELSSGIIQHTEPVTLPWDFFLGSPVAILIHSEKGVYSYALPKGGCW